MAEKPHVFEVWALMTRATSKSDFADQILADQEAMSRMQDEGGSSETLEVSPHVKKLAPKNDGAGEAGFLAADRVVP